MPSPFLLLAAPVLVPLLTDSVGDLYDDVDLSIKGISQTRVPAAHSGPAAEKALGWESPGISTNLVHGFLSVGVEKEPWPHPSTAPSSAPLPQCPGKGMPKLKTFFSFRNTSNSPITR